MQQLLTLQSYSQDKDRQEEFVQDQNERFARLMETVRADKMGAYQTRKQVEQEFGPPVFSRMTKIGNVDAEEWLYRKAMAYFKGDRVYFYFDQQGQVIGWEHVCLPEKEQGQQKT